MSNDQILVTQSGMHGLREEFDDLVKIKRPKAVKRISDAKAQGDLSENSEYSAALEEMAFIDGRIEELEEILKQAVTVELKKGSHVQIGSSVTVKVGNKTTMFSIVGEWEADPKQQKISHSSPLGKALIGKKKGEKVEVNAPVGKVLYQIIDVK